MSEMTFSETADTDQSSAGDQPLGVRGHPKDNQNIDHYENLP